MRIAIVNDMPMSVEVLRRVITAGGHKVAWVALNGADAVAQCAADRPDLVLMDLIMPVMDGVQATAAIMRRSPCAILIVTASVRSNAPKVFDAMGFGALDVVGTPIWGGRDAVGEGRALLEKIATIGKLIQAEKTGVTPLRGAARKGVSGLPVLVALASSTGGPKALAAILSALPRRADVTVVSVQHLDMQFSDGLAEWLSSHSEYPVLPVRRGMVPEPGGAFLAATNDHLVLAGDLTFQYTREPAENPYRPSADTFFASLRAHWPEPGVAGLLTGMGSDGADGLLALRQAGWHTLAQDEATSVIFGMPGAAARIGAAVEILSLAEIAPAILREVSERRHDQCCRVKLPAR